jgi:hypothetical protein
MAVEHLLDLQTEFCDLLQHQTRTLLRYQLALST